MIDGEEIQRMAFGADMVLAHLGLPIPLDWRKTAEGMSDSIVNLLEEREDLLHRLSDIRAAKPSLN